MAGGLESKTVRLCQQFNEFHWKLTIKKMYCSPMHKSCVDHIEKCIATTKMFLSWLEGSLEDPF